VRLLLLSICGVFLLGGQAYAADLSAPELLTGEVRELIPIGTATGIKLKSDGVMVTGFSELEDNRSDSLPARAAGLEKGDVIYAVDGEEIHTGEELVKAVEHSAGKTLQLSVKRGGTSMQIEVMPSKSRDGDYKVGILVRDSLMGIGTITFYEPQSGVYGALGHGISDPDSDNLVPISDGVLIPSTVSDVRKGASGNPGELHGVFETEKQNGTVEKNTQAGIYGHLETESLYAGKEALPICKNGEAKVGAATILSTVCEGEAKEYDIKILKLTEDGGCKDMLIEVTDPDLLAITGGIVQGMSGSPICQNGKIVGAVTHVCVFG